MTKTKKMILSAMMIALAMVLPFLTGQIPEIGSMLCPLHIPAILAGFFCGSYYGLFVGAVSPILRSMIFSMPPMMAAIPMAFEIATYGFVSGYLFNKLPKNKLNTYVALVVAMVLGRVVWGAVKLAMVGFNPSQFGWSMFISGAFITAIPGILLQLVLVPVLVNTLSIQKNK